MENEQALAAGVIAELPAPQGEVIPVVDASAPNDLIDAQQTQAVNQPYLINDNVDLNTLKALRDSNDIDALFTAAHTLLVALDERITSPDARKID